MTTVVQAIAAVMEDVREVRKDGFNSHQKFNFRGVDAVMNAVGPALRKHGVVCVPEVVEHEITSKTTGKGTNMNFVTVKVKYTFHGPEGDTLSGTISAESFDSGDKATAKAMSVAYRTFLLQALCLPTDDPDPDTESYQESRPGPMSLDTAKLMVERAAGDVEKMRALWANATAGGSTDEVLDFIRGAGSKPVVVQRAKA